MVKIDVYSLLLTDDKCYVLLEKEYFLRIRERVILQYGSLKNFSKSILKIPYGRAKWFFKPESHKQVMLFEKTLISINQPMPSSYPFIKSFYHYGSRNTGTTIPKEIVIDEQFVEGFSLYLGDGTTGTHGLLPSKKFRFTNADIDVIKFFLDWLRRYFPSFSYVVRISIPQGLKVSEGFISNLASYLQINSDVLRFSTGYYNKQIKYRVVVDNILLIKLFLIMKKTVHKEVLKNKKLMSAYIRGMSAAEGTAYFRPPHKYVRIEMKDKKEICFMSRLLDKLSVDHLLMSRSNRSGMCSIHIGKRTDLQLFSKKIGFGCSKKREKVLKKICF